MDRGIEYLHERGITDETIERYVLTYDAEQDAILIPYLDALGRLRCVNQRNLAWVKGQKWPPKYLRTHGDSHLYNVVDAYTPEVYLCEGEFDTLILKQLGLNAVGVPGVNNFQPAWAWLFAGRTVFVCFDADPPKVIEGPKGEKKVLRAGQDGAWRVRAALTKVSDKVQIVKLPEGHDITSLYVAGELEGRLP